MVGARVVQSATGDGNCDLLAVLVSVLAHTFHANAARRLCLLPCSVACCCFLRYELSANTAFNHLQRPNIQQGPTIGGFHMKMRRVVIIVVHADHAQLQTDKDGHFVTDPPRQTRYPSSR